MRVLVDMNLSPRLAALLNDTGLEAVHWSEVGPAAAGDPEIMEYARAHAFVVLTHDLDFSAILATTKAGRPSVVQVRAMNLAPDALAGPVLAGVRQSERALAAGAVLTIDPARMRVRLLPLNNP
jgi:predicted nuclease of predicted toxin-antitoxin system